MKLQDIRKEINFRELGGYETKDGRHVVHGKFYRSGPLGDLNEAELAYVSSLGIHHVFDFRSEYEAQGLPDPVLEGCTHHVCNAMVDSSGKPVNFSPKAMEEFHQELRTVQDPNSFMADMYSRLPFSDAYKEMFEVIKAADTPILFHCTAGKDRTGIAAVLVLLALGVDEETALYDYMLTNEYRSATIAAFVEKMAQLFADQPERVERFRAFEGVIEENAQIALQAIRDRCGDYETFFLSQFGLDGQALNRLRDMYTE